MRRDVLDLRAFYGTPLGVAARTMVARKLAEAWGDGHGLDVLGLGYATPPKTLRLNAWRTDVPKGAAPRTLSWVPRCNAAPGWGQVTFVDAG